MLLQRFSLYLNENAFSNQCLRLRPNPRPLSISVINEARFVFRLELHSNFMLIRDKYTHTHIHRGKVRKLERHAVKNNNNNDRLKWQTKIL